MRFVEILEQLKNKHKDKKLCIIIGSPITHSLSPKMHNNAYLSGGLDDKFFYDKIEVKTDELEEFVDDLREFNSKYKSVVGLTCTMPHKQQILEYLDEIKYEVKTIKASNSVVFDGKKYVGYNTDWYGILRPFIERKIDIKNKKVAILGAGGASRAGVYAFKQENCDITIFNNNQQKAKDLADEFGCKFSELKDFQEIKKCDIVANFTSVGMSELKDLSPVDITALRPEQTIFDAVYSPKETVFIKLAKQVGVKNIIYGFEMLLYQGVLQYELYTGQKPNIDAMKEVLI